MPLATARDRRKGARALRRQTASNTASSVSTKGALSKRAALFTSTDTSPRPRSTAGSKAVQRSVVGEVRPEGLGAVAGGAQLLDEGFGLGLGVVVVDGHAGPGVGEALRNGLAQADGGPRHQGHPSVQSALAAGHPGLPPSRPQRPVCGARRTKPVIPKALRHALLR